MKIKGLVTAWALLAIGLAAASCVRPDSEEYFIPASKAQDGVYVFDFEMADSLARYDVFFYTRVDGAPLDSLPLNVMWLSPSGESFSEKVYMDPSLEMEAYRTGVAPYETGAWRICVRPLGVTDGFRGLGLICKNNGTR